MKKCIAIVSVGLLLLVVVFRMKTNYQVGSQETAALSKFQSLPMAQNTSVLAEAKLGQRFGKTLESEAVTRNHDDFNSEETLLKEIKRRGLTNRMEVMDELALIGGDLSADVLISFLTTNFDGKLLNSVECRTMRRTLFCLGLISERSELALGFLRSRSNADAWDPNQIWLQSGFSDIRSFQSYLAGSCVVALGGGGRPEMWDEIRRIQSFDLPPREAEILNASFIESAHIEDLRKRRGPQALLNGAELVDDFIVWSRHNEDNPLFKNWNESRQK